MQYHFYGLNKILKSMLESATINLKSFARFCALGISAFMLCGNVLLAETERERERESSAKLKKKLNSTANNANLHNLQLLKLADSSDSAKSAESSNSAKDSDTDTQKVRLDSSRAHYTEDYEAYQSGHKLSTEMLEANPSGNGDIGSLLRILPNVQFDNAQLKSTTPGEIDPARISISGGLHYQNNFQLDGINMNNDLDPAGTGSWTGRSPGRSQGLAVDTSLLESIKVLDSNVSAAYGGFTGGVVEATTRKPSKDFGGSISYQFTQGNANPNAFSLTRYHLYGDSDMSAFLSSYDDSNQPNFTKHLLKANIESKINDKLGIIAAFSMTQSIIPLRRNDDSYAGTSGNSQATPIDPADSSSAKQNQRRAIYNYFLRANYDVNSATMLEFTYTYAPQSDYRFIVGTKGDIYSFDSGGHQLGAKLTWDNSLGTLTNTLSYAFLENSTSTNFSDTKYWQASDSKAWSNWATWVRSGGYAPSKSAQHTINNKLVQDFIPFDVGPTTHTLQVGLEVGYQYANFMFSKPYNSAVKTATFMTSEQSQKCQTADPQGLWCDSAKAYDTRGFESYAYTKQTSSATQPLSVVTWNNKKILTWNYGQYFDNITRFLDNKPISVNSTLLSAFIEDNITLPSSKIGQFSARVGIRGDFDTYMERLTLAPRLSINYQAPWNDSKSGEAFATSIIAGANRYYGRNLFAYRLNDGLNALQTYIYRNSPDISFDEILAQGRECTPYSSRERVTYTDPLTNRRTTTWVYKRMKNGVEVEGQDTKCISSNKSSVKFKQLKVPFVDELSIGLVQNIHNWQLQTKLIYRNGKDDIRYVRSDYAKLAADDGYASTYYTYTNDGRYQTQVITLTLENKRPIDLLGMKHMILFAFDLTNVKRNFNDYASSATQSATEDELIVYAGELIHWSQRPATNFVRPYTLRLNTTHTFNLSRFKLFVNNFFRYRSSYDAMARISYANSRPSTSSAAYSQYKPEYAQYDQYGKQTLSGAFTWDLRIGFETMIYKQHALFANIDIYNLLDAKNPTIASANYAGNQYRPNIAYEVGRQFWLQIGYKF